VLLKFNHSYLIGAPPTKNTFLRCLTAAIRTILKGLPEAQVLMSPSGIECVSGKNNKNYDSSLNLHGEVDCLVVLEFAGKVAIELAVSNSRNTLK
jgi:hypothetical protein